MMANPAQAVAGLAKGFADYLGLPENQVTVTKTVPDLFGGSVGARKLSDTSSRLEVEYAVLQAPGQDVTSQLETLASEPPPAALVQNLEAALADTGMVIEVEVLEIAEPEVVGTVPFDPPTPSPTPPPSVVSSKEDEETTSKP